MPQMSPLSWITTILMLSLLILMTKSMMKSGKIPHLQTTQKGMEKTQLKWKW